MDRAQVRHAVFARHSHPVSAWSRLLTIPLVAAPFWVRRPAVTLGVLAWFAVNPIMTPEPATRTSFATRAMLGEEIWLTDSSHDEQMKALNAANSAALVGAIVAAWQRRKIPTAVGVAAAMGLTLYGWRRYADIYNAGHEEGR